MEVHQLAAALQLPDPITCLNGVVEDCITALCMLLRRLTYPARSCDLEITFGWEATRFSRVCCAVAIFIYKRWKHLLVFDSERLTPAKLEEFCASLSDKGCPVKTCWAFIDGKLQKIARPSQNQRIVYNGWKRIHALKFHSLITPDGIHSNVWGPVEGRIVDRDLCKESGLAEILARYAFDESSRPLQIYGDPAYGLSAHLLSPFQGLNVTPEQARFNATMSKCREAVEWGFGELVSLFPYLDFPKNLKALLSPVGIYSLVGFLLCNAHTCLHIPQIPQYFNCAPPRLEEYFHGDPADGPVSLKDLLQLKPWYLTTPEDEEEEGAEIVNCQSDEE